MGNVMYAVLAAAGFSLIKLRGALVVFSHRFFALQNALQMKIRKMAVTFDSEPARDAVLLAA
ncbi:MAG: hypothetical protein LW629_12030 [Burkholderiales bacterium]|nr:hypothetical protein [Burkholderiales bacterium]